MDGTYARICCDTGAIEWQQQMKTPIFSSPRQLFDWERICVAEVSGTVHCIDFEGVTLWRCSVGGNVFSSFEIIRNRDTTVSVIFGCYDRNVYCLHVSEKANDEYSIAWRLSMEGQIFATPILLSNEFVLTCDTNGQVLVFRWLDGSIMGTYKADGQIFSSPAVCAKDRVFVGCRNNNLYCLQLSET